MTDEFDRRAFLQAVGGTATTLAALAPEAAAGQAAGASASTGASSKFTPVDFGSHFNASPADFGPRSQAKGLGGDGLIRPPAGNQQFRGIPFRLGPGEAQQKSWVVLSTRQAPWTAPRLEIPLGQKAGYLCLAQFCDWDENEWRPSGVDDIERVGQLLAEAVLIYDDGTEKALPIRRRFEVNAPSFPWGHWSFGAVAHAQLLPAGLADPLRSALDWGSQQTTVRNSGAPPYLWVCALRNPEPGRTLKALRLRAAGEDYLVVCGLTLFHGTENPLRYNRLTLYRITLPGEGGRDSDRWKVSVDLGVVARTYALPEFQPDSWLAAPDAGLGEVHKAATPRHLYAEVSAGPDATLWLEDSAAGQRYAFELGKAVAGQELAALPIGPRIQLLEPHKTWLRARVVDAATGRPTPVRLAFHSQHGRYIPPYGHRAEINAGWFQDYGADVKLRDSSFAYVDGTFQVELPVGEVYVEIAKGFEYEPIRKKLAIEPGQRELELRIARHTDLRSRGWVTADTHVHFLSPSTAVLEGQAEGLNLVNLLAAQWGDLYTNIGDLSHGPLASQDGETVVHVGTENRSHLLGHVGLLGVRGEPVVPLSGSFPSGADEAYLGDPLWMTMADWTDACRQREGLAVAVHFPYPTAELAADIVLGKIDAVEIFLSGQQFNTLRFLDWYRCLNCGYRLPAVGGTDKMSARVAVGAMRTYAFLGNDPFSFANWAKAVRRGNTFTTSGPLLLFQAEGRAPGEEIALRAGGGTVEVQAEAISSLPLRRVEIVYNGRVVASREEPGGARRIVLKEKIAVPGPGWLAARCASIAAPASGFSTAAHTSPVYLSLPGQEVFSAPAAAYLLSLIKGTQLWVEDIATRPDPQRLERIRAVLSQAHDRLHRRLKRGP
jgi:hypothetical protein